MTAIALLGSGEFEPWARPVDPWCADEATAAYVAGDSLDHWADGTELLPRAYIVVHFDMLNRYVPGLRDMLLEMRPKDTVIVGIDENTALCGDGKRWRVTGSGSAWIGAD